MNTKRINMEHQAQASPQAESLLSRISGPVSFQASDTIDEELASCSGVSFERHRCEASGSHDASRSYVTPPKTVSPPMPREELGVVDHIAARLLERMEQEDHALQAARLLQRMGWGTADDSNVACTNERSSSERSLAEFEVSEQEPDGEVFQKGEMRVLRMRCHGKDLSFKTTDGSAEHAILEARQAMLVAKGQHPNTSNNMPLEEYVGEADCGNCRLYRRIRASRSTDDDDDAATIAACSDAEDEPVANRWGAAAYDSRHYLRSGFMGAVAQERRKTILAAFNEALDDKFFNDFMRNHQPGPLYFKVVNGEISKAEFRVAISAALNSKALSPSSSKVPIPPRSQAGPSKTAKRATQEPSRPGPSQPRKFSASEPTQSAPVPPAKKTASCQRKPSKAVSSLPRETEISAPQSPLTPQGSLKRKAVGKQGPTPPAKRSCRLRAEPAASEAKEGLPVIPVAEPSTQGLAEEAPAPAKLPPRWQRELETSLVSQGLDAVAEEPVTAQRRSRRAKRVN